MGSGLRSICVAYQRGVLIMESGQGVSAWCISYGDVGLGVVGQRVVVQGVSTWRISHGEWAKEYLHGVSAWSISYGDGISGVSGGE